MTTGRTNAILWCAFGILSATAFVVGNMEDAPDFIEIFSAIGFADAVIAGILLWRYGISLATPLVIGVYVIANKNLFYLLFLFAVFWPKAAP